MKIVGPINYVDADISILGCTIKKGLQYFLSFIKNKGWVVIREDINEMILRGKYAGVDGCTMNIKYTKYKEIAEVEIDLPSEPRYKEQIYKNLVDAFNEKYGKGECSRHNSYYCDAFNCHAKWDFPKVEEFRDDAWYFGNNYISIDFRRYEYKFTNPQSDSLSIYFSDNIKRGKLDLEGQEAKKNKARGFSQTDI